LRDTVAFNSILL